MSTSDTNVPDPNAADTNTPVINAPAANAPDVNAPATNAPPATGPVKKPRTYYAATANATPERPALLGNQTCDICIVGAGFSGLSTALHLAESGLKVIVVEAVSVGFGASGRNGGQVINGYSRDFETIYQRYGTDITNQLMSMNYEGGDVIRGWIEKYKIECDYRNGSFFAAFTKKQMNHLEKVKEDWEKAAASFTPTLKMFTKADMPQVVDSKIYIGGLLDRRGGQLHPLNLALGEAAAFESLGGKIFENSRVIKIDEGDSPSVTTDRGTVAAKVVVVCGNAYLGDLLPKLTGHVMSVSSQIITTEVLGEELVKKMMPADYCIEDCNYLMNYYRRTSDHRLLFGGGVLYSGATPKGIAKRLRPHMAKTFPYLKDKKIQFAWSGNFSLTLARMPHIGRLSDTVYFIQGDSGHGVTTCHLLGKLVAEAINGQISRYEVFSTMRTFPFPGGKQFRVPLTALGALYYQMRDSLGI
jgi:gamma-glutamylputrescine oxidase